MSVRVAPEAPPEEGPSPRRENESLAEPLPFWAAPAEQVLDQFETSQKHGLTLREVEKRLARYGPNQVTQTRRRSGFAILWNQFSNLIVALLGAAALVAFVFGDHVEGFAIVAVLLINASIGFLTERRAVRSMEALRRLGHHESRVRREGSVLILPARELVPGDIVLLDAGDVLAADARLISGSRLQVDESLLTGESLPIRKDTSPVSALATLSERSSMLFKGTAVTRGLGEAVVIATGMATELGRISSLAEMAEPDTTPLEKRLDGLARRLIGITLVIAGLVISVAIASGRDLVFAVEIGIALAVATIPEGLPIVATAALARGMWRMAQRNAIVNQLNAVETLGSTSLILTDKTGTLTENRMTVVEMWLPAGPTQVRGSDLEGTGTFERTGKTVFVDDDTELATALRVAVLCNDATLDRNAEGQVEATGDPTEIGLLVLGAKAGVTRAGLEGKWPRALEIAFDPDAKRMATLHDDATRNEAGFFVAAKGAPEAIIETCTSVRTASDPEPLGPEGHRVWLDRANEMASTGMRVLALATARVETLESFRFEELTLLGLVGFLDPPRASVPPAIAACQSAGIRVVMVTGDHGATALTIARAVGLVDGPAGTPPEVLDARRLPPFSDLSEQEQGTLLDADVIARATPDQKLELIELHQRRGAIVAMTGDGVNDAPALKKADIGIAMGKRGTQVAREAADMVLQDDEFGTIVAAVAEGRAIFANIRKFVVYLMSCNVSEILAVGLGVLTQGPLPILPLQILFLNLVTDVFPALALGVGEGSPTLMLKSPRDPIERILSRRHWQTIFSLGTVMALSVLAALGVSVLVLELPDEQATTIAFLTLAMAQLWHVFTLRNPGSGWIHNEVTHNPWIWSALALCLGLLSAAIHWPLLADILSISPPGRLGWGVAVAFSLVPLVVGQLSLIPRSRRARARRIALEQTRRFERKT